MNSIYPHITSNIQVIFVDDGSNDDTSKVCSKYTDKIEYILQSHQGVSAARNNALRHCEGRYVSFVDADDYVEFGELKTVLQEALNSSVDVIAFGYNIEFYENDKLVHHNRVDPVIKEIMIDKNGISNLFSGIYGIGLTDYKRWCNGGKLKDGKLKGFVWCFLWKHDIITENNIYFPEKIIYNEDAIWAGKFFLHASTYTASNSTVYHYTRSGTGATVKVFNDNEKMARNKLMLLEEKEKIRVEVLKSKGIDLIEYFAISNALSIFEMSIYCSKIKGGYGAFKQYVNDSSVQKSIEIIALTIKKPVVSAYILLLKLKLFGVIFAVTKIDDALNIDGRKLIKCFS